MAIIGRCEAEIVPRKAESFLRVAPDFDRLLHIVAENGGFTARSRESRRFAGLELTETIESKNPVTLRIEADGYETMLLDVEGKKTFRAPIRLVPAGGTA